MANQTASLYLNIRKSDAQMDLRPLGDVQQFCSTA